MISRVFIMILFACQIPLCCISQVSDNLHKELKKANHDSVRCRILNNLFEAELTDNAKKKVNDQLEIICSAQLKKLSKSDATERIFKRFMGFHYLNRGSLAGDLGQVDDSEKFILEAIRIFKEINDPEGRATALNNLGLLLSKKGNIEKAISTFEESLKLAESSNNKKILATLYNNFGLVWFGQGEFYKAGEFFEKSFSFHYEKGNKADAALALNNIGNVHLQNGKQELALKYFLRGLKIFEETGDKQLIGGMHANLGFIYNRLKKSDLAIDHLKKSQSLLKEVGDKNGESFVLYNLSWDLFKSGKINSAKKYALESLTLSNELGYPENIMNSASLLSRISKSEKNYRNALMYYELWIKMKDSISNEATRKASVKSQLKYEYEKKAAADSVAHAKETEVKNAQLAGQNAEIKAKKNAQYALFGGLALVMIFAGFMFNRFKVTQRQKSIIELQKLHVEEQKQLVEEKQKEILDSIQYARRIQMAQIPSEKRVAMMLNQSNKKS